MPAQWVDVPLIGPVEESADDTLLDQASSTIQDFVPRIIEGKLRLQKRPGLVPIADLGTHAPVDGLYNTRLNAGPSSLGVVYVFSAKKFWQLTNIPGYGFGVSSASGTIAELQAGVPVKCVEVEVAGNIALYFANGGKIIDVVGTAMADADAPTQVTHLASLNTYLLANSVGTNKVYYSEPGTPNSWVALDFFSAESDPDFVVAIDTAYQELIVLGERSVEWWFNDGTPFTRIQGASQPFGTSAPYSLANIGGPWMWLDQYRRFVSQQGRTVLPMVTPFDRVVQRMDIVSDAYAHYTIIDGQPIYVITFPSAQQTLCYHTAAQQWHRWGFWNTTLGKYQQWRGKSYAYMTATNTSLVGDHSNGILYAARGTAYDDRLALTDMTGNPIRSLLRTGHISHGTLSTKQSHTFRLRCSRSAPTETVTDPKVMLRRRINNGVKWTNERWKSLGRAGNTGITVDWRRNGIYKTCQYELIHSDATPIELAGAQEYIEALGQ